jgi:hypothetical protein
MQAGKFSVLGECDDLLSDLLQNRNNNILFETSAAVPNLVRKKRRVIVVRARQHREDLINKHPVGNAQGLSFLPVHCQIILA